MADTKAYNREYGKARRALKAERGECTWCKQPRETGHAFCAECLERARERFKIRLANGLCSMCSQPRRSGKVLCQACADKTSQRAKDKRAAARLAKEGTHTDDAPGAVQA